ncbi:MAG: ABC transporter substrate-binding protein, partial [Stellaceae bacterium]
MSCSTLNTIMGGSTQPQAPTPTQSAPPPPQPGQLPPAPPAPPTAVAPTPPAPSGPPRIALLLPLSGPSAAFGTALLDAAQMALFDQPDSGIALLPRDTGGTADGAAAAARDAIQQGARIIIGPLLAAEVEAAKPSAAAANVP